MAIDFVFVSGQEMMVYNHEAKLVMSKAMGVELPADELTGTRDETLDAMAEIYGKGNVVMNTMQVVSRIISKCKEQKQQIASIRFVSHGWHGFFRIGREMIDEQTLDPKRAERGKEYIHGALSSLRPYFAKNAIVYIDACRTAVAPGVLKSLSSILGVAVTAWTGDVFFGDEKSYGEGKMVVCYGSICVQ